MFNTTISNLISILLSYMVCPGIKNKSVSSYGYLIHVIPTKFELFNSYSLPLNQTEHIRSLSCEVIITKGKICKACQCLQSQEKIYFQKK